MKRMIDYKEFKELEQLARETDQELQGLKNEAAKIKDFPDYDSPEFLTTDDIDEILEGDYTVLKFSGDQYWYVGYAPNNGNVTIYQFDKGIFYGYHYNDNEEPSISSFTYQLVPPTTSGDSGKALIAGADGTPAWTTPKKLYCHPITIVCNDTGYLLRFTCLIFNNSATPIDRAGFKAFLDSLGSIPGNLLISGAFVISTDTIISSYARYDGYQYYLIGVNAATGAVVSHHDASFDVIFPNTTTFEDGVNQIY